MRVQIEKLVYGGYGLARTEQGVIFVPSVVPGEELEISIDSSIGGSPRGRIEQVYSQSADRRTPACPYEGICGGCDWMHIAYERQCSIKQEIAIESLKRTGKLTEVPPFTIFPSPEYGYRIRAQFKTDEESRCGFYKKESNEVVDIQECLLLCESLNALLKSPIRKCTDIALLKSFKCIAGDKDVVSDPMIAGYTEKETIRSVGSRRFSLFGGSFFQNNRYLHEQLGTWARAFVKGRLCVDMYGGTGFFSVMVGDLFEQCSMVEIEKDQVLQANRNFKDNGLSNCSAVESTAEMYLRKFKQGTIDLLIVDPPRSGLTRTVRQNIAQCKPARILYISCNPSTQARDVGYLVYNADYRISQAALFDLYPNTHHMETALLLDKK